MEQTIERLKELDIYSDATHLFLYAIENELDLECIKIPTEDIIKLSKNGFIERSVDLDHIVLARQETPLEARIEEYRGLFSATNLGVPKMNDKKSTLAKMRRWLRENPEYSFDDVLEFTNMYLKELSSPIYSKKSGNFLFKRESTKAEEESTLSAFISELEQKDVDEKGWDNTI